MPPADDPVSPRQFLRPAGALLVCAATLPAVTGCTTDAMTTGSIKPNAASAVHVASNERECLMRAMYFESNRSSREGMLAVGSVVMNRVASPKFPKTICGVVGQDQQFAPGVMTRRMSGDSEKLAGKVADQILAGKRHPKVGPAMFFHTAGLKFPYHNMHYVAVAGGNAFYEKITRAAASRVADAAPANVPLPGVRPQPSYATAFAGSTETPDAASAAFASFTN